MGGGGAKIHRLEKLRLLTEIAVYLVKCIRHVRDYYGSLISVSVPTTLSDLDKLTGWARGDNFSADLCNYVRVL